ncbi:PPAP2B (predicted) [Pycnogonum litorale]
MVYLILYLQARFTWDYAHLLRPVIQVVAYAVAFYTALSRVSDYKHHPTDVIFGNILGTSVAVVIVFTLSGLFKMQKVVDLKYIMDRNEQKNHNFNDCKSNDLHIENIACASPV